MYLARPGTESWSSSADSYVSPRYENFFINEGTQTSEGEVGLCGGERDDGQIQLHDGPLQT